MRYFTVIATALLSATLIGLPVTSQALTPKANDATTAWFNVIPPTNNAKLIAWLNKKSYKTNFIAEPSLHTGSHGSVLTYYNPILALDLHAKKSVFRKGAAMVKELYSGTTVVGYAVMVKTLQHTTAQGNDWFFYETFDTTGQNPIFGKGLSTCTSCHQSGVDFLRSTFRP